MKDLVIVVLVMVSMFLGVTSYQSFQNIKLLIDQNIYYKQRYDYYFDGANSRRYLNLCYNEQGKLGVWYKDECKEMDIE
jgi:uncharacterized membrane protein